MLYMRIVVHIHTFLQPHFGAKPAVGQQPEICPRITVIYINAVVGHIVPFRTAEWVCKVYAAASVNSNVADDIAGFGIGRVGRTGNYAANGEIT